MFCDYTKIEYQDHSEYFNLPISEELRRRAIEAFDSEFVLQLGSRTTEIGCHCKSGCYIKFDRSRQVK